MSSIAVGFSPLFFTLDPTGRFAYVQDSAGPVGRGFNVDVTSGALTPMSTPVLPLPPGATLLVLSR